MHPSENDDPESRLPSQTNPTEKSNLHRESPPPNYSSTKSTTNGSTSSSSVPYTYQELPGSVVCPTCNGAGRIPRGTVHHMKTCILLYVCEQVYIGVGRGRARDNASAPYPHPPLLSRDALHAVAGSFIWILSISSRSTRQSND